MEAAAEQPGPTQPVELVSADVPEQQQAAEPAPQAQGPGAAAVQRPGPPPSARRTVVESPVIMLPGAGEQPRQLARSTVNFALLLPTLPGLCPASRPACTLGQSASSCVRPLTRPAAAAVATARAPAAAAASPPAAAAAAHPEAVAPSKPPAPPPQPWSRRPAPACCRTPCRTPCRCSSRRRAASLLQRRRRARSACPPGPTPATTLRHRATDRCGTAFGSRPPRDCPGRPSGCCRLCCLLAYRRLHAQPAAAGGQVNRPGARAGSTGRPGLDLVLHRFSSAGRRCRCRPARPACLPPAACPPANRCTPSPFASLQPEHRPPRRESMANDDGYNWRKYGEKQVRRSC